MKAWSYKAITENAETQIKHFMSNSAKSKSDFERLMYRNWAYGIYFGWERLTIGWIKDGDSERLEALTKSKPEATIPEGK
jgi:hypothetical protein